MIVYTCQVETETKKKEESEVKLIYYILILLLEFPLKYKHSGSKKLWSMRLATAKPTHSLTTCGQPLQN